MTTRHIRRPARELSHQGVRRRHRRHAGSSFRYPRGHRQRHVTNLVVAGRGPPTGAGATSEVTNRRCRAAVMVSHTKWITGVQILRLSVVLALVTCVIAAGISLVNAGRTHRCTVAVAVVARASAQTSVIRAGVQ